MTRLHPHLCTGEARSSARRINGKPSALGHLVSGQPQTSPQLVLIAHDRPRRLATGARSIVGRSVLTPAAANAHTAVYSPARGHIGAKTVGTVQTLFANARRTRPTFLHISGSENPNFRFRFTPKE